MRKNLRRDEIAKLVRRGIRNAEGSYVRASGVSLWEGPEYLITVSIFQSILKETERDCLTLELKPSIVDQYALKRSGRTRHNRKPSSDEIINGSDERINGRCDIILWKLDTNITRAIIEVKRDATNCHKDIERLLGRLDKGLEFGVLAAPLYVASNGNAEAKKGLRGKFDDFSNKIEKTITSHSEHYEVSSEHGNIKETIKFDQDGSRQKISYLWCPVTVLISKKS